MKLINFQRDERPAPSRDGALACRGPLRPESVKLLLAGRSFASLEARHFEQALSDNVIGQKPTSSDGHPTAHKQ